MANSQNTSEITELAKQFKLLRARHSQLKADAAEVWAEVERVQAKLFSAMDEIDLSSMRIKDVGNVIATRKMRSKAIDRHALYEHLRKINLGGLITETINWRDLDRENKLFNEQNGKNLDGVETYYQEIVKINK